MSNSTDFPAEKKMLYEFFNKGQFVDISFKVNNQNEATRIGAHKVVLASCSDVFRAMFETEMKESQTQEVEISDVDEEAFRQFLNYIYTQKVDNGYMTNCLPKLFMLADKYNVLPLIESCVEFMKGSLSTDNAVDYLQIAELYREKELMEQITDFINLNTKVLQGKPWAELYGENPTLASSVIQSLMDKRDNDGACLQYNVYNDIINDDLCRSFCDMVVTVDTKEFPVHKFILIEKSSYFAALFEKDTNNCRMEDITPDEFRDLMDYIYFNRLPPIDCIGILKAAKKCELPDLVQHCMYTLKQQLSTSNVISILITAKNLKLTSLKTSAILYIITNIKTMKRSSDWGRLAQHPDLLTEICIKTRVSKDTQH